MSDFVYRVSRSFFLTANIVRQIEGKMVILYPSSKKDVVRKVGNQLIKMYLIGVGTMMILFWFADISLYYAVVAGITIYTVSISYVYRSINRIETKILHQFIEFIETVKFRFQFEGMIEEALLEAITGCRNYEMSLHGQIIYEYLKESYSSDRGDYQEISPNHFFLTFYSLCESVIKYGDKKTDSGSLFIKNLGYLKEDINMQILKKEAIDNTFMGLTGICIIPIYCIKPIEKWAEYNMPELTGHFDSSMGQMTTLILSLLSVMLYEIIMKLKYPVWNINDRKKWVEKIVNLKVVNAINAMYMNRNITNIRKIELLLREVAYPYNIAEFCVKRFVSAVCTGIAGMVICLTMGFGMVSFFIGVVLSIIWYYGQVMSIKMRKQLILFEREDEIIRFQGIILMLMHADKITVEQILEQLERFAVSFKKQIEEISDKLSYKGIMIFKEYRDKSDFLPFNRIIDGFIACDDMYIHKAFEDIEMDRRYYIDKHKQENAHTIEQRGAVAKFLSFIPMCAVIIIKLVVPFTIEGIRQMAMSNINF